MHAAAETLIPVVRIVDDDASVCRLVTTLLNANGIECQSYASAGEFFRDFDCARPGCVVIDVRMVGMTGIELQERLRGRGIYIPTIVISGDLDVATAVRAMKNQAVDVLEKPFLPRVLLDRVRYAIDLDMENRKAAALTSEVTGRLKTLTAREMEVFMLVVAGHANKHVARTLSIAEKTVEAHRGRVMKKLGARNVVELVRLAQTVATEAKQASQDQS
jgi:FixJ family two-component response regulator